MNYQNKCIPFLSKTCLILLFVFFFLPNAWAGTIFEFHPILESETQYDDNILYTQSNTISDWITTISPGFVTSLSHPRFNYELEFKPGFRYYLQHPEFDYNSQEVDFNATIKLTSRLTFSFYDRYIRSNQIEFEELVDTDYEREVRRTTLTTFNRNIISPRLEYRFGRENLVSLYYRNTGYRSEQHFDDDYREQYVENRIQYWFNVRNGIRITSHFTKGNFDIQPDLLHSFDITGRYMRRFTPHFVLYGEYGYGEADFEDRRFFQSLDDRREFQLDSQDVEDFDLSKFNFGFEWILPANFQMEGSIGYFWRNGVENRDEQGINSLFEINKTAENLNLNMKWESGSSANYFVNRNSGFSKFWRISTRLDYRYHERLEFKIRGSYGYREYTDARGVIDSERNNREDYTYSISPLITYHILQNYGYLKNLSLELEFNYSENDSTRDSISYIKKLYTGRIIAAF